MYFKSLNPSLRLALLYPGLSYIVQLKLKLVSNNWKMASIFTSCLIKTRFIIRLFLFQCFNVLFLFPLHFAALYLGFLCFQRLLFLTSCHCFYKCGAGLSYCHSLQQITDHKCTVGLRCLVRFYF